MYNQLFEIITENAPSHRGVVKIAGLVVSMVGIDNQLKQEFASVRFLFYEGINNSKPHFSDKDVVLMDTLDYSDYSFSLEKIKIAFRVCYSIFDKISYFINIYLNLGLDKNRVSFRTVWYNYLDKKPIAKTRPFQKYEFLLIFFVLSPFFFH